MEKYRPRFFTPTPTKAKNKLGELTLMALRFGVSFNCGPDVSIFAVSTLKFN